MWKITARGRSFLEQAAPVIHTRDLRVFPEFLAFQDGGKPKSKQRDTLPGTGEVEPDDVLTPEEAIARSHRELNQALAAQLLDRIKEMPPGFFERLIVMLMLRLGYGGAGDDSGAVLGRSGDGGVDGIIKQDKLDLDAIYLQAKRFKDNSVGAAEIREFVGALVQRGASKGVFITTSTFSPTALSTANSYGGYKLSLIDGIQLAKMMIENDLRVSLVQKYDAKKIDSDFFSVEGV